MSLYEIAKELRAVEHQLDAAEFEEGLESPVAGILEQLKHDTVIEVEQLVRWRENIIAEAEALDKEQKILKAKRDAHNKRADGIKDFIASFLKATNQEKFKAGIRSLFFRKGSKSLLVAESEIENWSPDFFDAAVTAKALIPRYEVKVSVLKTLPGYLDQPGVVEQIGEDSLVIR